MNSRNRDVNNPNNDNPNNNGIKKATCIILSGAAIALMYLILYLS